MHRVLFLIKITIAPQGNSALAWMLSVLLACIGLLFLPSTVCSVFQFAVRTVKRAGNRSYIPVLLSYAYPRQLWPTP